jgi:hypothetical protein
MFLIGIEEWDWGDYADSGTRIFNTGSPFNVVAGQGSRNINQLVAHYEKLNANEEEKKAQSLASKESWVDMEMQYPYIWNYCHPSSFTIDAIVP